MTDTPYNYRSFITKTKINMWLQCILEMNLADQICNHNIPQCSYPSSVSHHACISHYGHKMIHHHSPITKHLKRSHITSQLIVSKNSVNWSNFVVSEYQCVINTHLTGSHCLCYIIHLGSELTLTQLWNRRMSSQYSLMFLWFWCND